MSLETPRIHVAKKTSVAKFVRSYLTDHGGQATIYDIYSEYRKESINRGYKPVKYSSIRIIVYVLRKVGVIKDGKSEDPMYNWTRHKRKYIKLIKGQEGHPVWNDVWKFYRGEYGEKKLEVEESKETEEDIALGEEKITTGGEEDEEDLEEDVDSEEP